MRKKLQAFWIPVDSKKRDVVPKSHFDSENDHRKAGMLPFSASLLFRCRFCCHLCSSVSYSLWWTLVWGPLSWALGFFFLLHGGGAGVRFFHHFWWFCFVSIFNTICHHFFDWCCCCFPFFSPAFFGHVVISSVVSFIFWVRVFLRMWDVFVWITNCKGKIWTLFECQGILIARKY